MIMWVECASAHEALADSSDYSVYDINGDGVVNVGDVAQLITYVSDPASGFPEAVNAQYSAMVKMEPGVFGMGASWESAMPWKMSVRSTMSHCIPSAFRSTR